MWPGRGCSSKGQGSPAREQSSARDPAPRPVGIDGLPAPGAVGGREEPLPGDFYLRGVGQVLEAVGEGQAGGLDPEVQRLRAAGAEGLQVVPGEEAQDLQGGGGPGGPRRGVDGGPPVGARQGPLRGAGAVPGQVLRLQVAPVLAHVGHDLLRDLAPVEVFRPGLRQAAQGALQEGLPEALGDGPRAAPVCQHGLAGRGAPDQLPLVIDRGGQGRGEGEAVPRQADRRGQGVGQGDGAPALEGQGEAGHGAGDGHRAPAVPVGVVAHQAPAEGATHAARGVGVVHPLVGPLGGLHGVVHHVGATRTGLVEEEVAPAPQAVGEGEGDSGGEGGGDRGVDRVAPPLQYLQAGFRREGVLGDDHAVAGDDLVLLPPQMGDDPTHARTRSSPGRLVSRQLPRRARVAGARRVDAGRGEAGSAQLAAGGTGATRRPRR